MNYEVKIKYNVSSEGGAIKATLEDMGCESIEEWQALSEKEKEERLQNHLDSLPEQPYMNLENYSVTSKK